MKTDMIPIVHLLTTLYLDPAPEKDLFSKMAKKSSVKLKLSEALCQLKLNQNSEIQPKMETLGNY